MNGPRRSGTQETDIHAVFKSEGFGIWVPLPQFPHQHEFNRAIHNLRRENDLNIQNEIERSSRTDGRPVTHSFYRLLPGSWQELRGKPEPGYREPFQPHRRSSVAPKPVSRPPAKSWEEIVEERDRKLTAQPEFSLVP